MVVKKCCQGRDKMLLIDCTMSFTKYNVYIVMFLHVCVFVCVSVQCLPMLK